MAMVAGRRGGPMSKVVGARGRERKTKRRRESERERGIRRAEQPPLARSLLRWKATACSRRYVTYVRTYGRTGWRFEDVDDDVGWPKRGGVGWGARTSRGGRKIGRGG